jgi:hypothetical protein
LTAHVSSSASSVSRRSSLNTAALLHRTARLHKVAAATRRKDGAQMGRRGRIGRAH